MLYEVTLPLGTTTHNLTIDACMNVCFRWLWMTLTAAPVQWHMMETINNCCYIYFFFICLQKKKYCQKEFKSFTMTLPTSFFLYLIQSLVFVELKTSGLTTFAHTQTAVPKVYSLHPEFSSRKHCFALLLSRLEHRMSEQSGTTPKSGFI